MTCLHFLAAHIEGAPGRYDCHPKTADPQLTILTRVFKGGVQLKVERAPESQMTDDVLHKKYELMSVATYKMWLADIDAGWYKVVKQEEDD